MKLRDGLKLTHLSPVPGSYRVSIPFHGKVMRSVNDRVKSKTVTFNKRKTTHESNLASHFAKSKITYLKNTIENTYYFN